MFNMRISSLQPCFLKHLIHKALSEEIAKETWNGMVEPEMAEEGILSEANILKNLFYYYYFFFNFHIYKYHLHGQKEWLKDLQAKNPKMRS